MSRDDWIYVGHMLDSSRKALGFISGINKEDYEKDEKLRLALTYIIQVIGEAAQHVSSTFQEAHPDIAWHEIIGMRHHIVHDYMNVDEDVVWEVVQQDLPMLIEALIKIIPSDYL